MPKKLDIRPGDRYGRLTILKEVDPVNKVRRFLCICDCGNYFETALPGMCIGATKSCGCLARENAKHMNYKNGLYKTRLHSIWQNMKQRCYNPNYKRHKDYGGRGIMMCGEWLNDFTAFYNWAMNNGYEATLSIDRIDNNGDYEPGNCKWSNNSQQNRNTRNNRFVTFNGETKTLAEWSNVLGINYKTLQKRLNKGLSPDIAFTMPLQKDKSHRAIA